MLRQLKIQILGTHNVGIADTRNIARVLQPLILDGDANLYVNNLDSSITNARLHTIFSKYRIIQSFKVAEENGKSKGFRFVQFDYEDSALSAIAALHQYFLEGKQLSLTSRM